MRLNVLFHAVTQWETFLSIKKLLFSEGNQKEASGFWGTNEWISSEIQ